MGRGGFFRDASERSRTPRHQGHHRRTRCFRTDFAGSSTELREGRPEYDATVGTTARFQRDYNGKQPGDPTRAAAALLKLASVKEPPLRIVLGIDAFNVAEANDLAKIELGKKWKDLSYATDFEH